MPINPDWSRIANKAQSLITAPEAEQLLAAYYYSALDAAETATDTATRHLLQDATWQAIQKRCDGLPELLTREQYRELVRSLWKVLDAGLHRTVKDAGVQRQVYAQYQARIRELQGTGENNH